MASEAPGSWVLLSWNQSHWAPGQLFIPKGADVWGLGSRWTWWGGVPTSPPSHSAYLIVGQHPWLSGEGSCLSGARDWGTHVRVGGGQSKGLPIGGDPHEQLVGGCPQPQHITQGIVLVGKTKIREATLDFPSGNPQVSLGVLFRGEEVSVSPSITPLPPAPVHPILYSHVALTDVWTLRGSPPLPNHVEADGGVLLPCPTACLLDPQEVGARGKYTHSIVEPVRT